ncbi:hypothetical protein [Bradyrhizobium sp.]|jgi:hypothetical protein|uniref:hypothetical protein n=1 Tax=Bradyrhizobium sp. TaxID=376 RepID=UPI002DDD096B|nr:hypothetical protein [Bradyrhizobium sp.]HEV2159213.1 hypothetical protein [Bradyrhizobium sp.]
MTKRIPFILAFVTAGGLFAVQADAAQTAYVAASAASPSAACTITAPCTTIAAGLTSANAGGEVVILDSATYNEALNITKTVVITAPNRPIIVPPGGSSAFTLATANVTLSLSGVIIDGAGGTASGINVTNGRNLFVSDTSIRNFTGPGVAAIYVTPPSGVNFGMFVTGTSTSGNNAGIVADGSAGGTVRASVRNSLVSVNTNGGLIALANGPGAAVFLLHQVLVQGNGVGIATSGGAGFLVDDSRIIGNSKGISAGPGSFILSYGNNNVAGNFGNDGAFTGPVALQ